MHIHTPCAYVCIYTQTLYIHAHTHYILEKEMATHSSILAWRIDGWKSLVGYSPWGCKESDTTEYTHYISTFPCINIYIIQVISLVAQMVKNLLATRES